MYSRVKKTDDESEKGKMIFIGYDDDDDNETCYGTKSAITYKQLTRTELDTIHSIFNRHIDVMNDDIFGRSDVFSPKVILNRTQKKAWPPLPAIAITQQTGMDYQKTSYRRMGDTLIKEYMDQMVEKGIFLPTNILDKIPIIDMTNILSSPKRTSTVSALSVEFNDKDIYDIKQYGWKAFVPYFDEQIIRMNRNRYIYTKLLSFNKKERMFSIHREVYIGDKNTWLCSSKADIGFTFEPDDKNEQTASTITIGNYKLYEQLISEGIPLMKWDKQKTKLWTDMFECPTKPEDLILLTLKDPRDIDDKDKICDQKMFVYGSSERNTMLKMFGNCCSFTKSEDIDEEYKAILRRNIVPDYINLMGALFLSLNQNPEIKEENGKLLQKFGKLIVRSENPIKRKGGMI